MILSVGRARSSSRRAPGGSRPPCARAAGAVDLSASASTRWCSDSKRRSSASASLPRITRARRLAQARPARASRARPAARRRRPRRPPRRRRPRPVHDDRAHPEHCALADAGIAADVGAGVEHRAGADAACGGRPAPREPTSTCAPELGSSAHDGLRPDDAALAESRRRAHVSGRVNDRRRAPAVLGQQRPELEPVSAEPDHRLTGRCAGPDHRQAVDGCPDPVRIDELDQPDHLLARRAGVLDDLERERACPRDVELGHAHGRYLAAGASSCASRRARRPARCRLKNSRPSTLLCGTWCRCCRSQRTETRRYSAASAVFIQGEPFAEVQPLGQGRREGVQVRCELAFGSSRCATGPPSSPSSRPPRAAAR